MANSFNFADIMARSQQDVFMKKSVAMILAENKSMALTYGKSYQRPYSSVSADDDVDVMNRTSDLTVTDVSDTIETLTVDKQRSKVLEVHDWDEIQSSYPLASTYGDQFGELMKSKIDMDVLYEVVNSLNTVDAGSVWGTAGQGIDLSSSNVAETVFAVTRELHESNVIDTDFVAAVSPKFEQKIASYYGAKVTDLGDNVSQNGYFNQIAGFKLYSTNNLTCSAVLALGVQPTANDTVTIGGVTFTFVASPTNAGDVDLWADVDATRANLAALINAPWTTTAGGVALSTANIRKFTARVVAVNDNTANTLTVYYKGANSLTTSSSLTSGSNLWTSTLKKQLNVFGIRNKCTTLIFQKKATVEVTRRPLQFSNYIKSGMLYGIKTFKDNAQRMVKVEILDN